LCTAWRKYHDAYSCIDRRGEKIRH
jgi:hypothetical protein